MAKIDVDSSRVRSCGMEIIRLTQEYFDAINALYSRINNMPTTTLEWTGNSANKFVQQLNVEKKQYEILGNTLKEYGTCLVNTADTIDKTIIGCKTEIEK